MDKNLGKFVIGTQFFLLIGLLVLVPTLIEIGVKNGFQHSCMFLNVHPGSFMVVHPFRF